MKKGTKKFVVYIVAFMMLFNIGFDSILVYATTPSNPGNIEVNKEAKRLFGECRIYEVILNITGTPPPTPVDVVLVLDSSLSMSDTINTYNYTVRTTTPSTNSSYYVKVNGEYIEVNYTNSGSQSNRGWRYSATNNNSNLRFVTWSLTGDDNLPGNSSNSNPQPKIFYTRTTTTSQVPMVALKSAANNFANIVLGSGGIPDSRIAVVKYSGRTSGNGAQSDATLVRGFTDNLGQVNTAINSLTPSGGTNTESGLRQALTTLNNANQNSNKVVVLFSDGVPTVSNGNNFGPQFPTSSNSHINAAISAATDLKISDPNLKVFSIGLFQSLANRPQTLNLADSTMNSIQNSGYFSSPSTAELNDIFEEISTQLGYSASNAIVTDVIGNNFELVEGTLPTGATYDSATNTITWDIGFINEAAELKYKISARPDFAGGVNVKTNESAILKYTNIENITDSKTFPIPLVDVAAILEVELEDQYITAGDSISLGDSILGITGGDGNGDYTYEWRLSGTEDVLSTDRDYSVSPTDDTQYELTVTDSNNCVAVATMWVRVTTLINIDVEKEWNGGEDRPEVTINLLANENKVDDLKLNADNEWKDTFTDLPKFDDSNNEITYTITEDTVQNYNQVYTGNVEKGFAVTNTYVSPGDGSFTAYKVWDGGTEPIDKVEFQLYRQIGDGPKEAVGSPVSLESNSYTWNNLVVTNLSGETYIYSFEESTVPENYVASRTGNTVTNTFRSPLIDIEVDKVWINGEEIRPEITINLLANGELEDSVTLYDPDDSHIFEDLPIYDDKGIEIKYTVDEEYIDGYTSKVTGGAENGFTVTNTKTEAWTGSIEIQKFVVLGEDEIEKAQSAANALNDLFIGGALSEPLVLEEGIGQEDIDYAQAQVDALSGPNARQLGNDLIAIAQDLLDNPPQVPEVLMGILEEMPEAIPEGSPEAIPGEAPIEGEGEELEQPEEEPEESDTSEGEDVDLEEPEEEPEEPDASEGEDEGLEEQEEQIEEPVEARRIQQVAMLTFKLYTADLDLPEDEEGMPEDSEAGEEDSDLPEDEEGMPEDSEAGEADLDLPEDEDDNIIIVEPTPEAIMIVAPMAIDEIIEQLLDYEDLLNIEGLLLEDFQFQLFKVEGDEEILIGTVTTDDEGKASFKGLFAGTYILREIDRDGYISDLGEGFEFELNEDTESELSPLRVVNTFTEEEPDPDPNPDPDPDPDDDDNDDDNDDNDDDDDDDDEEEEEEEEEIVEEETPEVAPEVLEEVEEIEEVEQVQVIEEVEEVVEAIPQAAPVATLPRTGTSNPFIFSGLGTILLGLGFFLKKKE